MGKKGRAVLGRNMARTQQKTKKVIRSDKQEGYLHTTRSWASTGASSISSPSRRRTASRTSSTRLRWRAEKWNIKLVDAVYIDIGPAEGVARQLTEVRLDREDI